MYQGLEMVPVQCQGSDFVLVGFWYQNQKSLNIELTLVRAKQKNDLYIPVRGSVISGWEQPLGCDLAGPSLHSKGIKNN